MEIEANAGQLRIQSSFWDLRNRQFGPGSSLPGCSQISLGEAEICTDSFWSAGNAVCILAKGSVPRHLLSILQLSQLGSKAETSEFNCFCVCSLLRAKRKFPSSGLPGYMMSGEKIPWECRRRFSEITCFRL